MMGGLQEKQAAGQVQLPSDDDYDDDDGDVMEEMRVPDVFVHPPTQPPLPQLTPTSSPQSSHQSMWQQASFGSGKPPRKKRKTARETNEEVAKTIRSSFQHSQALPQQIE
jgi:hypothetical protein